MDVMMKAGTDFKTTQSIATTSVAQPAVPTAQNHD
jgi:hypothetical protein